MPKRNPQILYRGVINQYGAILERKLEAGKMDETKFWKLQGKLTEWYHNFPAAE